MSSSKDVSSTPFERSKTMPGLGGGQGDGQGDGSGSGLDQGRGQGQGQGFGAKARRQMTGVVESSRATGLSSAAFLHHLHTDPSSHHVSLAGPPQRMPPSAGGEPAVKTPAKTASNSPRSIDMPLEPTIVPPLKPIDVDSHSRAVSKSATHTGEFGTTSLAGPSRPAAVRRTSSKRSRPSTAPVRTPGDGPDAFGSPGGSIHPSPNAFDDKLVDDAMFIPAQEDAEMDMISCDMPSRDLADGMGMLQVGGTGTTVVGRASGSPDRSEHERSRNVTPQTTPPQLSWRAFGQSYAHGLFEPNRIPNPPLSNTNATLGPAASTPALASSFNARASNTASSSGSGGFYSTSSGGSGTTMTSTSSAPVSSIGSGPSRSGMAEALAARKKAFELETLHPSSVNRQQGTQLEQSQLQIPRYSLAAATMRMAATGYQQSDFSPLGIPSPERELLDPMANFVSPGSASTLRESASSDPGSGRGVLTRSMSHSTVARSNDGMPLPTIIASPAGTPLEHPTHNAKVTKPSTTRVPSSPGSSNHTGLGGIVGQRIPPATAPIEKSAEVHEDGDYFGAAVSPRFERQSTATSQSSSNRTVTHTSTPMMRSRSSEDHKPSSTRVSEKADSPPPLVHANDLGEMYEKHGWLPAPLPPNEEARRKALYRFNILHTSPDVNFDRIAHMAKLVFNTKIVIISLIDGEDQWHKSDMGLGATHAKRVSSFCSHTLLITSGEPFIVLDTLQDWRFVNHPYVVGPSAFRFYAGAPLRTADGYNLGSLCIIDDKPRTEFTPRSRLILKEFAAVTMREMELWRDKLQLRVRDKIQISMEKFTRECLEMDVKSSASNVEAATRMDQVYTRAASLVCSTLDMDGCFVLDLGEFEMVDIETDDGVKSVYRVDPYSAETTVLELSGTFGPVNAFPVLASTPKPLPTRALTGEEHHKLSDFLTNHRDGRIFENVAPSWIKYLLPSDLRYGMVVPVFGVNQQPFAMICAYSSNKAKQYLEGYELQFLRAIGVIILSAVLRRRMVLADKTKSVLISSVSHELRTPLHGILAAAELLSDTDLDSNQMSFLKTVQTCGNTLIETVNHVLDFTKLSGSSGSNSEGTIKLAKVNLASLVEQTVEGVWIGQRARFFMGDADIGSFYAPPPTQGLLPRDQAAHIAKDLAHVETVIDIGVREKGWMVRCERGGLRRVLMNLVGNSLKFTKDGYVQVTLKELPHPPGSKMIPVEMAVIDTGKGIGKDFLKDQLFHPFSQENPMQTGTGLGLAIVNSIVRSDNVNGKVDVWSSEGAGTEIRISFEVEVFDEEDDQSSSSGSSVTSIASGFGRGHSVSFHGYDVDKRGNVLALDVLSSYAASWHFDLREDADIVVLNEDEELLYEYRDRGKAMVFLSSNQTQATIAFRDSINRAGGHCQIVHKPIGPTALRQALQRVVVWIEHRDGGITPVSELERPSMSREASDRTVDSTESGGSADSNSTVSELSHRNHMGQRSVSDRQPLMRRRSEEQDQHNTPSRPSMAPRGLTYHHGVHPPSAHAPRVPPRKSSVASDVSHEGSPISLADGGVMLKAAQLPASAPRIARTPRVMVVEDNIINRRVLGAFLRKRGYEYQEAHDGLAGVQLFEQTPVNYWDVILMDISMPVMNGHEATRAIRKVEAGRRHGKSSRGVQGPPAMSSARSSISEASSSGHSAASDASSTAASPPTIHTPTATSATTNIAPTGVDTSTTTTPPSGLPTAKMSATAAVAVGLPAVPEPGQPVLLPPHPVIQSRAKIFALTGLATADDKREAFGSGVDGYLVKPVSLTSLDLIFKKIGY